MGFLSVLSYVQQLVRERVSPGDAVIDGTLGNGNDTLFLLGLIREAGSLYGFDLQPQALGHTRRKLADNGWGGHPGVHLFAENHAGMKSRIPADKAGTVSATMFNLGYLPGGDHRIITRSETTLPALDSALSLLRKGGVATIVLYPGHEGGAAECDAVVQWAESLPQHAFQVLRYEFVNQRNSPPFVIAVEKRLHIQPDLS